MNFIASQSIPWSINFWAPYHGKGLWDSEGWQLKRKVNLVNKAAKTNEVPISDAKAVFEFATKHFQEPVKKARKEKGPFVASRTAYYLPSIMAAHDRDAKYCKLDFSGILSFFSFQRLATVVKLPLHEVAGRALSCACQPCREGRWSNCKDKKPMHRFNQMAKVQTVKIVLPSEGPSRSRQHSVSSQGSSDSSRTQRSSRSREPSVSSQGSTSSVTGLPRTPRSSGHIVWQGVTREDETEHRNVKWVCKFCKYSKRSSSTAVRLHFVKGQCKPIQGKVREHKEYLKSSRMLG